MLSSVKERIHVLTWLLMNPAQVKHLIIRETLYRQRNRNRQGWVEWQKYDTYTAASMHSTAVAYARPLNLARINVFTTMISGVGKGLTVLDVGCGDGLLSAANRENGQHRSIHRPANHNARSPKTPHILRRFRRCGEIEFCRRHV